MRKCKALCLLLGAVLFMAPIYLNAATAPSVGPDAASAGNLPQAVRGVWLTNVDSQVLNSRAGIEEAVALCADIGINAIFVVTWNKGRTLYPSAIMKNFSGVAMDPALDPNNTGRDPLQELIDAAHRKNIKVFAWFEFGFAASYQRAGGELVARNPHWAALGADGKLVTKNGFDWLNALDKDVQQFMNSLVLEVVNNYNVDGIQGDDRLPALPSEAGYNPETVARYRSEMGINPPRNSQEPAWVDWRAAQLNDYAEHLYREVKAADGSVWVSFSPSVFPWSKREYLQDWPAWLAANSVDLLIPQLYRHDLQHYEDTLKATLDYIPQEKRAAFAPGLLIKVGEKKPSVAMLEGMLDANRAAGIRGEVYFFYEGLADFRAQIKRRYDADPVVFPSL
ncbi:family 10 glycosylhydrolase [Simiduia sp. 21SJ11W-1]|uniref:glycoside hydrolase family 10 protein n=1 Tax=Simiduia sp. 21SJ11W-1 TaxID=2909669 RepID=UPI0020A0AB76|nr:family 10 glycosylhydrolase [Simiduia sp. 21SJ11W-1]UTA48304.1 family 10 glycosylhydrolase [Simiduia sp. 21SJ11W-1]